MLPFSQPVRIARILTRFGVGGVERHVSTLTANLDPERFRSWLICGRAERGERECPEFCKDAGVAPLYVDSLKRSIGLSDLSASIQLRRLLNLIQPHIVETHQSKAGALGRSMALLNLYSNGTRPRLIHTFHGHQFTGYFNRPVTKTFIAIERWLAKVTDIILTVTATTRRQIINDYEIADASRVRVVPLGFDFSWLNHIPKERGWLRARFRVGPSTVIFGTVGRLVPIKNTEFLLRSFARMVHGIGLDARLVVIGDGELRAHLESIARENSIADKVLFAGSIFDRARIFSDLDATCLSSHNEGSPVCLIESLSAGIPIVATRVGGVPDVASSELDGELVEPGNEEAYAAALSRMALLRRQVPDQRRAAHRAFYSVERLLKDMQNIYSELLTREVDARANIGLTPVDGSSNTPPVESA